MRFQKGNKLGNRIKKGEVYNPNGRAKGHKHLKTCLKELLSVMLEDKDLNGKNVKIEANMALALSLIKKGLTTGDYKTIEYITNTVEGTKPQPDEKPLKDSQIEAYNRMLQQKLIDYSTMKDVTK